MNFIDLEMVVLSDAFDSVQAMFNHAYKVFWSQCRELHAVPFERVRRVWPDAHNWEYGRFDFSGPAWKVDEKYQHQVRDLGIDDDTNITIFAVTVDRVGVQ